MLGENSAPAIFSVNTNTNYSTSDYNGFRPNPGAEFAFQWNSPPFQIRADYSTVGTQKLEVRRFPTLAEYSKATHQDEHSVILDYDTFVNVPRLDAKDLKKVQL